MSTMAQKNADFVGHFTTEFHNLEGITIAEKKKILFQLFNKSQILHTNQALLDTLTSQLQPQTYLENLFFVEFLIHFHQYHELARQLFENENEIVVRKITKQRWFFEKCLSENPVDFVKRVIPTLSCSLAGKVLKNLPPIRNEEAANEIFDFLLQNYGILEASKIISSCSSDKIETTLTNNFVILPPTQLQLIFDKNPHLIYTYLRERERLAGDRKFMDSNPLFQYIADKNIEVYQDLCLKYDFKVKLGREVSKKFIRTKRVEVLAHPKLYIKNLHPRCVIRELGPDFPKVFLELFPRKLEDSPNSETSTLIKYYPKKHRYNLVLTTYNQIFAKKLEETPHLIDDYILKMVPDSTERERLAKLKSKDDSELKYYRPETCLKLIKEKINFARDPFERAIHVGTLMECCSINQDYDALLVVLKFVTERFKNDVSQVVQKVLQMLTCLKIDTERLNEEHWTEIRKIAVRSDVVSSYDYPAMEVKYIDYLLRMGRPIRNEVEKLFKAIRFRYVSFDLHYLTFVDKKNMDRFLSELIEVVPRLVNDTNPLETLDCVLLSACLKHNWANKKNFDFSKFPRLLQSVKTTLKNKKVNQEITSSALQLMICNSQLGEDFEELRREFWKHPQFATPTIMKWFVQNRPNLIKTNLKKFLTFALTNPELIKDKKLWLTLKCYPDLKIADFCGSNPTPTQCSILPILMEPSQYLKLLEQPRSQEVQVRLLKGIKHTDYPVESLRVILKNCTNDSAQFCLGALRSVIPKVPRRCLKASVDAMMGMGVPWVTKVAYHTVVEGYETELVLASLKESESAEICLKYFLRNPTEESWALFTSKLTKTTRLGKKRVPPKYQARYFETVWGVFHATGSKSLGKEFDKLHKEAILELKPEFLSTVIQKELFYRKEMNRVACIYLLGSNSPEKINIIANSLQKFKTSQFSIKPINEFITTLFGCYMKETGTDLNLVDSLLELFQQLFKTVQFFEEYIIMSLMKFKNKSMSELSGAIVEFYNAIVSRFGETVVEIFANVLKQLLPELCESLKMYELFYLMLNHRKTVTDALLVVHLLPESDPEDISGFNYYQLILEQLQQLDFSVQLYLNLYFQRKKDLPFVEYYESSYKYCYNMSSWLCPGARKKIGYCYY